MYVGTQCRMQVVYAGSVICRQRCMLNAGSIVCRQRCM